MDKSEANHPLGLVFIAAFYMFGAVDLLVLLFANPSQTGSLIAQVHGLPRSTGSWILPLIAGLGLLIAYGLFSRSRWGYVLTLFYLVYFGCVNGLMLRVSPPLDLSWQPGLVCHRNHLSPAGAQILLLKRKDHSMSCRDHVVHPDKPRGLP